MRRKPHGARKTKKQAPPQQDALAAEILAVALAAYRRYSKADYVVHIDGVKITKLRRSWGTAREARGATGGT